MHREDHEGDKPGIACRSLLDLERGRSSNHSLGCCKARKIVKEKNWALRGCWKRQNYLVKSQSLDDGLLVQLDPQIREKATEAYCYSDVRKSVLVCKLLVNRISVILL